MFYMNPCYVNYFDSCDTTSYITQAADNISLKPYIKCTRYASAEAQYCEKIVDAKSLYVKYSNCYISAGSDVNEDLRIVLQEGSQTKILYVYDAWRSYGNRALMGRNDIGAGYWVDHVWHFFFEDAIDGKKCLRIEGIVGSKSYSYTSTVTYDDPKIHSIQFAGYQHLRDIAIADFPLHINDEIVELPITAHAGDFVDKGNGKYDLLEAEKIGTATVDTSAVKTENTRLVAVSYLSSTIRNNDDITGVEIGYAGGKDLHALQDGANMVVASFEGDAINKEALGQLTVTAKKV